MDGFKKYLVEVQVTSGNDKIESGTGFPVGKNMILTASHVAHHSTKRHGTKSREVLWRNLSASSGSWKPAELAWDGKGLGLDAALLKSNYPMGVQKGELDEDPPKDGKDWYSEGFSIVGGSAGLSMSGKTHGLAPNKNYFEVSVNASTGRYKHWRGASGSPVFVGDKIVGVLAQTLKRFRGKLLQAVPTSKLLASSEFRNLIGHVLKSERHEKARQGIIQVLSADPDLTKWLSEKGLYETADLDFSPIEEKLAEVILGHRTFKGYLTQVNVLHRELCSANRFTEGAGLIQATLWGAPAMAKGFKLDEEICRSNFDFVQILRGSVNTHVVAELALGIYEHRKVDLVYENGTFVSKYHLRLQWPEGGIYASKQDLMNALKAYIDLYLDPKVSDHPDVLKLLSDEMVFRNDGAPYITCLVPGESGPLRDQTIQLLTWIKEELPAVLFVDFDHTRVSEEAAALKPLEEMLIRQSEVGNEH